MSRVGLLLVLMATFPFMMSGAGSVPGGFSAVEVFSAAETGLKAQSYAVVQDTKGVLHFGSFGLLSFDGDRWTSTSMNSAYAVRGLDWASEDKLWAGAIGEIGWFSRGQDRWTYTSLTPHVPDEHRNFGEIFHAFGETEGALFVGKEKILRWNGKTFRVWPMDVDGHLSAVRHHGTIFVQSRQLGLYKMGPDGPEPFLDPSTIGPGTVYWIEQQANRWTLITSDGLFTSADGGLEPVNAETNALIKASQLTSVVELSGGRLALGTFRKGILIISKDGTVHRVLAEKDGLPTAAIHSVAVDREGQVWGMSGSFIFRLPIDSPSSLFDARAGVPAKPISKIIKAGGSILALSDGRAYLQGGDGAFVPFSDPREHALDLNASSSGSFAVASLGRVRAFSNLAESTLLRTTPENVFVAEPSRRRSNRWWLSEGHHVAMIDGSGALEATSPELPDIAASIAEDREGFLWLGTTTRGVQLLTPEAELALPPERAKAGLPHIMGPTTVVGTIEGDVVVFGASRAWIKAGDAKAFEDVAGFPPREIVAVAPTPPSKDLWVILGPSEGHGPMVGRINIHDKHAAWQPHSVDDLAKIGTLYSIAVENSPTGRTALWIGGTGGILRNSVPGGPQAPTPLPPLLRVLARSNKNPEWFRVTGALPYSIGSIMFEFALPQFANHSGYRLETKIDGIDRDWVPAGPSAQRELTAVRDARYEFLVRAVADTGVASSPTVFEFQVLPPWWRSTPAIVGAVLALFPLGFSSYWLRVRALRHRNSELEKKVRHRTKQLEAASAAKTQFVAHMSHDIRNPLNGIVGLALALEDTPLDQRQQELIATLRECTTYLSSLVDDVLDFASIEAGRVELRLGPFVPRELLRSIVQTLQTDATESGGVLSVEVDPNLPPHLMGDAGRIQQILVNFVSNALKYAGGHIQLSVRGDPDSPGEVEFAVTDHGAGMDREEQGKLFTKFSRLSQTHGGEEIPGTGLGLASCRHLADLMSGSVGVESRVGHGARFFLRLPLTSGTPALSAPVAKLPNSTVLLVEDTDYNAWAATAVLARLGLSCERAHTGEEALRLFSEKRFNVVLLDRNLPDMDGTEVAQRMRKMETEGSQAVLLGVTAYCTTEDRSLCLQSGMDAFVGKPLTPDKLRKALLEAGGRLLAAASVQVVADAPDPSTHDVDLAMLTFLSDGSTAGLDFQIARYLEVLATAETQLKTAWDTRDYKALKSHAHRLIGHVTMVGAVTLAEAAAALESAADARNDAGCSEALDRVRDEARAVKAAMHHRPRGVPSA